MSFYKHPNALVESDSIGKGTRVWAFAHVLPKAKIGEDCNICDNVFVENDVVIGDRVTVKCGVQLWDGVRLENDVFVGPNATFTNDIFPRSKVYPEKFSNTVVHQGASIGANATILPGITIGANAMIGAGAVVTRSVPSNAIVVGNPAKIVGYVDSARQAPPVSQPSQAPQIVHKSKVQGVELHSFPLIRDLRGDLSVGEFEKSIPFAPKRYFVIFNVPSGEVRGEHAHRECHQFLVCVKGSCSVVADDGKNREEFVLNSPHLGLYLPPMVWGIQYKYSSDAVLAVFASHFYDSADYIREYPRFLAEKNR